VCHNEYSRLCLTHHFEVPVIVVFTKYDQFLHNVEMHLADYPNEFTDSNVSEVVEKQFQEHYLHPLGDGVRFVRLESGFQAKCQGYMLRFFADMHRQNRSCNDLIEKTAAALNEDIITLMLLAVQKGNLELSVKMALNR
jgi:hypothetical protein